MRHIFEDQIKVQVLGSGSKGNATLIAGGGKAVLIDAGLSGRELIKRLASAGIRPDQLTAVILTHEHNDHVRGLKGLLRVANVPVWANIQTATHLRSNGYRPDQWNSFDTGQEFEFSNVSVASFAVPHDAYDPCGFVVTMQGIAVGILTDLGYCTEVVCEAAARCHVLCLEANYDVQLLSQDTKRPWATKQRISARHGHLSNEQASALLAGLDGKNAPLRHVFLGHMSEDCNSPEVALPEIQLGLQRAGLNGVEVHLTYQSKVSDIVVI